MSIRTTVGINYVAAGIAAAAPLMALPYYLAALGSERWGLVSFAMMLAVTLSMFEIGISQRLVRDLTVLNYQSRTMSRGVFRAIEIYYWLFAVATGITITILAPGIVVSWLHLPTNLYSDGYSTIYFCAILLLAQIPSSAYRSSLIASGWQVHFGLQQIGHNIIKHVGGVIVVSQSGELNALYLYLGSIATIDVLTRGAMAHYALPAGDAKTIQWQRARLLLASGLRMSLAVVASVFALQLDKVFLSRLGSLTELGVYSIAASLAYGALQVTAPLVATMAPILAVAATSEDELEARCKRLLMMTVCILLIATAAYVAVGERLVHYWLKNDTLFEQMKWTLRLLLVGSSLNTLYQVGYQRWIALGQTRTIMQVNVLALIIAAFLTPILIVYVGMIGATVAWIILNVIGLSFQIPWLVKTARRRCSARL